MGADAARLYGYKAKAVFQHRGYTSMTGVQYVSAVNRYVLTQWACMNLDLPNDGDDPWSLNTILSLRSGEAVGPWKLFHVEKKWGTGNCGPSIPSAWFEEGGRKMWMIYAGCWTTSDYAFLVRPLRPKLE
jgi:hypothetical protein